MTGGLVSDTSISFVANSRGQLWLVCGGYTYHANKRATNTSWRCTAYYRCKCACRCITTPTGEIRLPKQEHNHPPDVQRFRKIQSTISVIMTPKEFFAKEKTNSVYCI